MFYARKIIATLTVSQSEKSAEFQWRTDRRGKHTSENDKGHLMASHLGL